MTRGSSRRRNALVGIASAVGLAGLVAIVVLPSDGDDRAPVDALGVSMVEMAFIPDDLHASPGQEVLVTNDGALRHSLLVVGLGKGVELSSGERRTFTLPEETTGTYQVVCDIPGHLEAGMVATLTISDGRVTPATRP